VFATPTVVGDLLYIGSCSGVFYAFDRESGGIRWTYDTANDGQPASFHGDPLIAQDLIIVGADAPELGHLYAFDRDTGAVRWKTPYGRGVPTDILALGSSIYALTMQGELLCIDRGTGEKRWGLLPKESGDPPRLRSSLLLQGNRIFFTTRDRGLQAVDAKSGKSIWKVDLGAHANTNLARIGASLYVGTMDERFLRVDSKTGKILSTYDPGGLPFGTPVVTHGSVLLLVTPGWLARLSPSLELTWVAETGAPASSFRPLILDDTVLIGDEAGQLYSFRLSDGTLAWTDQFEGVLRGLGSSGGIIYLGTLKGEVYAFRP